MPFPNPFYQWCLEFGSSPAGTVLELTQEGYNGNVIVQKFGNEATEIPFTFFLYVRDESPGFIAKCGRCEKQCIKIVCYVAEKSWDGGISCCEDHIIETAFTVRMHGFIAAILNNGEHSPEYGLEIWKNPFMNYITNQFYVPTLIGQQITE